MADEAKSIILEYPNISLKYAVEKNGVYFDEFPELIKGEYGYKLCVGDKLHCIRYRGTNKDIFVNPEILDIREDGLLIKDICGRKRHRPEWNKEHTSFISKAYWNMNPFFVPFRKFLVTSFEVYNLCEMYIEPCIALFEKNRLDDVLLGNIPDCTDNDNTTRKIGTGIYYNQSGRRWADKLSDTNLKHFIKLGQQTII